MVGASVSSGAASPSVGGTMSIALEVVVAAGPPAHHHARAISFLG